ncbi:hypothetical protein [Nocardioides marmorisolisilvae]|uniref:Uncharacterized protein n=1 Tax=Nocardioides marmorisolisilvae TaxID=1542737 RepID=A0A3N0DQ07_9ACTN|nr:hypothetical protein [Nocardioides marmorisolisilvae]RNL77728.1 hypothetical protein EFL95_17165 [Nocardioides marmorisolisilvae]
MTTTGTPRRAHPVPAASRLLAGLNSHGLGSLVDARTAADIDVAARFVIRQFTCACDLEPQTHIVGEDCPPHPMHPSVDPN